MLTESGKLKFILSLMTYHKLTLKKWKCLMLYLVKPQVYEDKFLYP